MGLASTLLSALAYPKAANFNHQDEPAFRALVAWLENVKIRHYPVAERKALGDVKSASWPDAFAKYLQDLECPLPLTADNRQAVLQWMLSFAVSLEYADNAEQYNATASKLLQQSQAAAKGQLAFSDLHNPEVQQQLVRLLQLLHVDTSKGSLAGQLQTAVEVLRDCVLPSLTDASAQHSRPQDFPLGFHTGDAAVDNLAMLLRMLYIKDLRSLQSAIDRMLVQVQEYTANPRTDASLGKVGH